MNLADGRIKYVDISEEMHGLNTWINRETN
jgi:hypothetical protein